jgi:enoyl-CoA hydratase
MPDGDGTAPAVLTEVRDGVLLITLNRPEARNAVNGALAEGVAAAVERLEAEAGLRVGVITGAGRGFCSGMDLKAFLRGEGVHAGGRGFAGICEKPPTKPMIAAVEGFAVAGGLEVALSCDLIVAGRGARLGIPETKRGLIAGAGALIRLPARIPRNVAMEMALTGEVVSADRAYDFGLVNTVCEDGAAVEEALRIAATIAANGPLAVRLSKQIVDELVELPEAEAWRRQQAFIDQIMGSDDAREGAAAFAEKRDPAWTGK